MKTYTKTIMIPINQTYKNAKFAVSVVGKMKKDMMDPSICCKKYKKL